MVMSRASLPGEAEGVAWFGLRGRCQSLQDADPCPDAGSPGFRT